MDKSYLSDENFKKLDEVIESNKERKGALMPVLHEAQHIFGSTAKDITKNEYAFK